MSASGSTIPSRPGPELLHQTVVIIGGSAGIGLGQLLGAPALRAPASSSPGAIANTSSKLRENSAPCAPRPSMPTIRLPCSRSFRICRARLTMLWLLPGLPTIALLSKCPQRTHDRDLTEHLLLALNVARSAARKVRPGGSLIFVGGTGARRPRLGLAIVSTATVAFPALVANLALERPPIRVNLIAAGFVDTPLSASLLGDELKKRRDDGGATLPIGRVVGPADVAALAVHIMSNTALTGATYDIDGGQQLVRDQHIGQVTVSRLARNYLAIITFRKQSK